MALRKSLLFAFLFCVGLQGFGIRIASAQSVSWVSPTDGGNWSTGVNWDNSIGPGAANTAVFGTVSPGSVRVVTVDAATTTTNILGISIQQSSAGATNRLNLGKSLYLNAANDAFQINQTAGAILVYNNGYQFDWGPNAGTAISYTFGSVVGQGGTWFFNGGGLGDSVATTARAYTIVNNGVFNISGGFAMGGANKGANAASILAGSRPFKFYNYDTMNITGNFLSGRRVGPDNGGSSASLYENLGTISVSGAGTIWTLREGTAGGVVGVDVVNHTGANFTLSDNVSVRYNPQGGSTVFGSSNSLFRTVNEGTWTMTGTTRYEDEPLLNRTTIFSVHNKAGATIALEGLTNAPYGPGSYDGNDRMWVIGAGIGNNGQSALLTVTNDGSILVRPAAGETKAGATIGALSSSTETHVSSTRFSNVGLLDVADQSQLRLRSYGEIDGLWYFDFLNAAGATVNVHGAGALYHVTSHYSGRPTAGRYVFQNDGVVNLRGGTSDEGAIFGATWTRADATATFTNTTTGVMNLTPFNAAPAGNVTLGFGIPDHYLPSASLATVQLMRWFNRGAFNVADGVTVRWKTYSNAPSGATAARNELFNQEDGTLTLDGTASFLAVFANPCQVPNHGLNIYNAGAILKTGVGASELQLNGAGTEAGKFFENTGVIHVEDPAGTLNWKLATLSNKVDGVLSGYGTLKGAIVSEGIIAPGTDGTAGRLILSPEAGAGNVTMLGGELRVDVFGTTQDTEYDRLFVSGKVLTLAGDLVVNLGNFLPARTDSFPIVTAQSGGSIAGTFANTPDGVLTIEEGITFEVDYSDASVVVLHNFRKIERGTVILMR